MLPCAALRLEKNRRSLNHAFTETQTHQGRCGHPAQVECDGSDCVVLGLHDDPERARGARDLHLTAVRASERAEQLLIDRAQVIERDDCLAQRVVGHREIDELHFAAYSDCRAVRTRISGRRLTVDLDRVKFKNFGVEIITPLSGINNYSIATL
jgi:hypothetical protein